jgi:hypothetical protein
MGKANIPPTPRLDLCWGHTIHWFSELRAGAPCEVDTDHGYVLHMVVLVRDGIPVLSERLNQSIEAHLVAKGKLPLLALRTVDEDQNAAALMPQRVRYTWTRERRSARIAARRRPTGAFAT